MTKKNRTDMLPAAASESDQSLLLENQLCFPLYAASRMVIKLYSPVLEAIRLTYTQYITMLALWEKDALPVKMIGQRLYLDSGTLTPLLKKLEQRGLIERRRDEKDERNVLIYLTPEGRKLKAEATAVPYQVASCIGLSHEEALELQRLLRAILFEACDPEKPERL